MISDRIDAITSIPQKWRGEVIPAPKSVKISITETCNYSCRFCTKSINKSSGDMDRALFSRLIREMRDAGVEECGLFFIGESFLCSWLPDAIAEAKSIGYPYVFLTTNGSAATPERVKACMKAGLDSLKFSMNYYSGAQLKSVAQVTPRFWRQSIDNLKSAASIKEWGNFKCNIYASSIAFDGEQGKQMQAVVDEIKPYLSEHYWLPLFSMNGASKSHGMKPGAGNPGRLAAMREPLPCWSVTSAHIDREGFLVACCFGDTPDHGHRMADLKTMSFMEGWNSEAFVKLRRAHIAKDVTGTACETCIAA